MIFDIQKLFGSKSDPAVKVRAKRAMLVNTADGTSRTVEAGEVFEMLTSQLRGHEAGDLEYAEPPTKPVYSDPTPDRPATIPAPSEWSKLPKCFREFHDLEERFRVARLHRKLIVEKREFIFGTVGEFSTEVDSSPVLSLSISGDMHNRENLYVRNRFIDPRDPETQFQNRKLDAAFHAATAHLDDLAKTFGIKLQLLFLECSRHRLEISQRLDPIVDELAVVGFEIFKTRVAALGLAESQARRLYCGSADAVRFNFPGSCGSGLCILRVNHAGCTEHYFDDVITTTASHALRETGRIAELEPLLVAGRKELATARASVAA